MAHARGARKNRRTTRAYPARNIGRGTGWLHFRHTGQTRAGLRGARQPSAAEAPRQARARLRRASVAVAERTDALAPIEAPRAGGTRDAGAIRRPPNVKPQPGSLMSARHSAIAAIATHGPAPT